MDQRLDHEATGEDLLLLGCDLNDDMGTTKKHGAFHCIQSSAIGDMGLKEEGFAAQIFREMLEKHDMVAYNKWEDGNSATYFGHATKEAAFAERIRTQPTARIDFLC